MEPKHKLPTMRHRPTLPKKAPIPRNRPLRLSSSVPASRDNFRHVTEIADFTGDIAPKSAYSHHHQKRTVHSDENRCNFG